MYPYPEEEAERLETLCRLRTQIEDLTLVNSLELPGVVHPLGQEAGRELLRRSGLPAQGKQRRSGGKYAWKMLLLQPDFFLYLHEVAIFSFFVFQMNIET